VRNFQRGEVRLRTRTEIHYELVAVAELNEPRAVRLAATDKRPAGAERGDAHLIGRKRLGVGIKIIALAAHGRSKTGDRA